MHTLSLRTYKIQSVGGVGRGGYAESRSGVGNLIFVKGHFLVRSGVAVWGRIFVVIGYIATLAIK